LIQGKLAVAIGVLGLEGFPSEIERGKYVKNVEAAEIFFSGNPESTSFECT
jgi:hypothetical protein